MWVHANSLGQCGPASSIGLVRAGSIVVQIFLALSWHLLFIIPRVPELCALVLPFDCFLSAIDITDSPPWTQPRGFEKEGARIPRDTTLSRDEPVTSRSSDVPPESTEARAAEMVESDIAATSGPEVESQETGETKRQEAPREQWGAAAVAATASEEPAEKSMSSPLEYDVVTE